MRAKRSGIVVGLLALVGIASAHWSLRAQDREAPAPEAARAEVRSSSSSVLDAMERPFPFTFGEPTRLDEVCRHLGRALRAPVTLDRAALDRQEVRPEDTVQLELQGVRLKIGLKLLLEPLGLTYRVVPEDNLLILTDNEGSEDPLKTIRTELKALHRDVHDLQDAVDDVLSMLGADGDGPKMHKPTIIEEVPAEPAEKQASPEPLTPRPRPGI